MKRPERNVLMKVLNLCDKIEHEEDNVLGLFALALEYSTFIFTLSVDLGFDEVKCVDFLKNIENFKDDKLELHGYVFLYKNNLSDSIVDRYIRFDSAKDLGNFIAVPNHARYFDIDVELKIKMSLNILGTSSKNAISRTNVKLSDAGKHTDEYLISKLLNKSRNTKIIDEKISLCKRG